jgi:hypothetical protein
MFLSIAFAADLPGMHENKILPDQISPFIRRRPFSARRMRFGQGRIFDAPPKAVARRAILDESDPLARIADKR